MQTSVNQFNPQQKKLSCGVGSGRLLAQTLIPVTETFHTAWEYWCLLWKIWSPSEAIWSVTWCVRNLLLLSLVLMISVSWRNIHFAHKWAQRSWVIIDNLHSEMANQSNMSWKKVTWAFLFFLSTNALVFAPLFFVIILCGWQYVKILELLFTLYYQWSHQRWEAMPWPAYLTLLIIL